MQADVLRTGTFVLVTLLAINSAAAPAKPRPPEPQLGVEVRFGGGMSIGGGAGVAVLHASPITANAIVDFMVRTDPSVSIWGGLLVETFNRTGFGLLGGLRLHLGGARLALGAAAAVAPYTIFGPLAAGGYCLRFARIMRLCGDIEGTIYVIGSDLPDGRIAAQLQFLLGVGFDAL